MMKSKLVAALESAGVDVTSEDERSEAQLQIEAAQAEEAEEQIELLEEQVRLVQSLESLAEVTQGLIDNDTASPESAELVSRQLAAVLGDEQLVDEMSLSTESMADVKVYHQHAVASMEGIIRKIKQNIGEAFKNAWFMQTAMLTNNKNKADKFVKRAEELRKWFNDRKKEITAEEEQDTVWRSAPLASIYHVAGKRPENFERAVLKDAETVTKVIKQSAAAYTDTIKTMIGLVEKAKGDEELVADIKKLKHPLSHLSSELLADDVLLRSRKFKLVPGKPISTAYDFGQIAESMRVNLDYAVGSNIAKALPEAVFGSGAAYIAGKAATKLGTVTNVIDGVVDYVRVLNSAVRGQNRIEDLSVRLAGAASKAVENGVSRSLVNAINSIIVDMSAAHLKLEGAAWRHGFGICSAALQGLSSLAMVINKGEAPKEVTFD